MRILLIVVDSFNISISDEDAKGFRTVGQIIDYVKSATRKQ